MYNYIVDGVTTNEIEIKNHKNSNDLNGIWKIVAVSDLSNSVTIIKSGGSMELPVASVSIINNDCTIILDTSYYYDNIPHVSSNNTSYNRAMGII